MMTKQNSTLLIFIIIIIFIVIIIIITIIIIIIIIIIYITNTLKYKQLYRLGFNQIFKHGAYYIPTMSFMMVHNIYTVKWRCIIFIMLNIS